MANYSVLAWQPVVRVPWGTAGVGVAAAADSSRFINAGAEHPVNHFTISLPPAAEPCVLFPWQPENSVKHQAAVTLEIT